MTTWPTDGSRDSVQTAIDNAQDGDIVTLPADGGTPFEWDSGVTVSNKVIEIRGAGAARSVARSDTIVAVGTGTKVFTLITEDSRIAAIEALKSEIIPGATFRIVRAGGEIDVNVGPGNAHGITGNLPWMEGTVTSLVGNTLTMNITSTNYSGSHAPWCVMRMPQTTIVFDGTPNGIGMALYECTRGNVVASGIHFENGPSVTGNTWFQFIGAVSGGKAVLIHDCSWNPQSAGGIGVYSSSRRGGIWNCCLPMQPASYGSSNAISIKDIFELFTTSWSTLSTMGTADTDELTNFYIEDCDFHFNNDCIDTSDNARTVIRHCLFNNSGTGFHGCDTSFWGTRHFEVYSNRFVFSNPAVPLSAPNTAAYFISGFFVPRGGTGLFYDNLVDDINSPLCWGDNPQVAFQIQNLDRAAGPNPVFGSDNDLPISAISVANPTVITTSGAHGLTTGNFTRITGSNSTPVVDGYHQVTVTDSTHFTIAVNVTVSGNAGKSNRVDYHCPRQVGFGYVTGAGVDGFGRTLDENAGLGWIPGGYVGDVEPLFVWGNSGADCTPQIQGSGYNDATDPDLAQDYLIEGRDYVSTGTAKPGWTPAPYPYALRDTSVALAILLSIQRQRIILMSGRY